MNESTLSKLTISGFRGIVEEEMTPQSARLFACVFAEVVKEKLGKSHIHLLIGRDGRASGQWIEKEIATALADGGNSVTVGGILTTPSILFLTKTFSFDAALIITASHNPAEYNGLKFVMSDGLFASKEIIVKMKQILQTNSAMLEAVSPVRGEAIEDTTLAGSYIRHIVSAFTKLGAPIRVLLDPVNASGSIMGPEFLRSMGAEVITINDEPIGEFSRPPEPNPAALSELGKRVLGYAMDIGFGLDPDGDRLVVVDENGIPVFEEYTLALAAKAFYEKLKNENALASAGPLVVNLSTSRTLEDVAKAYGIETVRSSVGEPNVVEKMIETGSYFGGEGNGGVIFRPINFCRDSFVGMALILNLLETSGKKVSELVAELPQYIMLKQKIEKTEDFAEKAASLPRIFPEAAIDESDGIRLDFPDTSWVQVRASNTEPIVRIFGESKDPERIEDLINKAKTAFL